MTREIKRIIEFGKDKAVVRRTIRNAAEEPAFAIPLAVWSRSQPSSTRRGVNRGNFVLPSYVTTDLN